MDFTREPIIETVITPKEGWMLVIRNSKSAGQEEYFVDAVEVVTFGSATFYRTQERPKAFMVPVSDYEVVEVRETRMVLKNITLDRSIKIGSGKEFPTRNARESIIERPQSAPAPTVEPEPAPALAGKEETSAEERLDRKRDRKRNFRRKRVREEVPFREEEGSQPVALESTEPPAEGSVPALTSVISNLLPPPPTLISETIARYKDNALFKGAFFSKEEVAAEREKKSQTEAEVEIETLKEAQEAQDLQEELDHPELPQMSLDYPVYGLEDTIQLPYQAPAEAIEARPEPQEPIKEASLIPEQLEMSFDNDLALASRDEADEEAHDEAKHEEAEPNGQEASEMLPEEHSQKESEHKDSL